MAIVVTAVVVLTLIAVTYIAYLLISAGTVMAHEISTAAQPDALANGWLVVATAFVAGVAPLIALGAAVGRAFAGGMGPYNTGGESDTEDNPGEAARSRSLFSVEPAVAATAVAAIVQLFVLLSGTPEVSSETQAAIVAGVTALAGLYIRQKALA